MKNILRVASAAVLAMTLGGVSQGAGNGAEAFEKMKSLAGHWEEQKAGANKATLDLELTSGGNVIRETLRTVENGKPEEMTTMYYLDGDQLKLTHYCTVGNQPTMRGTYAPEARTLTFDFVGATNMKSPNDGHMHHAVYTFVDNDHLKMLWTFQKDQKDAFSEEMTYVRK